MIDAVQGGDQRGKLGLFDILQLVDEQHQRRALLLRRFASGLQQVGEVAFEIAAVGYARLRLEISAKLKALIFNLPAARKTGERPHRRLHFGLGRRAPVEFVQGGAQRWDEQAGQRAVLWRFNPDGREALRLSLAADFFQQNRLADAAQAIENEAARRPA